MQVIVAPGDTVRVTAQDVNQMDNEFVQHPVTGDLDGTLTVKDWNTGATISGPSTLIQSGISDDWYYDLPAPGLGRYRLVVVLNRFGAQRTLYGELKVENR
jgi:hypothetical protein